jgi:hypothetical protein
VAKFDSKKLLKTLTAGQGSILAPHLDEYLKKGKFPPEFTITISNRREPDPYFHPSSDCYTPPIELWKRRKGLLISRKTPAALHRTFAVGHMWHGYLQNILIDMGFVQPDNVELTLQKTIFESPEVIGKGTADLVDVQIPGHGSWLVDIKTMGRREFEAGAHEYTMMKWQAQVNCYMDWLGTEKAFILAVCKDSPHAFREYQIVRDQNLLDEIYDRWLYTQYCLDNDKEPEVREDIPKELQARGDSVLDEVEAAKYVPEAIIS